MSKCEYGPKEVGLRGVQIPEVGAQGGGMANPRSPITIHGLVQAEPLEHGRRVTAAEPRGKTRGVPFCCMENWSVTTNTKPWIAV